jgi:hypothetical protein
MRSLEPLVLLYWRDRDDRERRGPEGRLVKTRQHPGYEPNVVQLGVDYGLPAQRGGVDRRNLRDRQMRLTDRRGQCLRDTGRSEVPPQSHEIDLHRSQLRQA